MYYFILPLVRKIAIRVVFILIIGSVVSSSLAIRDTYVFPPNDLLASSWQSAAFQNYAQDLYKRGKNDQALRSERIGDTYASFRFSNTNVLGAKETKIVQSIEKSKEVSRSMYTYWKDIANNYPEYRDAWANIVYWALRNGDHASARSAKEVLENLTDKKDPLREFISSL